MALTLTMLLESRRVVGAEKSILVKSGLGLLVQNETATILFGTRSNGSFTHSTTQVGVGLTRLTAVMLPHGHCDHCDDVPQLVDGSRVICHPQVACERYASVTVAGAPRKIKKLSYDNNCSRFMMEYIRGPLTINDRFLQSGEISVPTSQSHGVISEKVLQPDYISDEGVLIYKSVRRLVIIAGCEHWGIENIVRHCQRITGANRIYVLAGGFHSCATSPAKLRRTRQFIQQQQFEKLLGYHYTDSWRRL